MSNFLLPPQIPVISNASTPFHEDLGLESAWQAAVFCTADTWWEPAFHKAGSPRHHPRCYHCYYHPENSHFSKRTPRFQEMVLPASQHRSSKPICLCCSGKAKWIGTYGWDFSSWRAEANKYLRTHIWCGRYVGSKTLGLFASLRLMGKWPEVLAGEGEPSYFHKNKWKWLYVSITLSFSTNARSKAQRVWRKCLNWDWDKVAETELVYKYCVTRELFMFSFT